MSVRNSIFLTAERAMPPKIATIGFQMPRPWNFIAVTPCGASNSSSSIETFGRSPEPRTTSFPFSTTNFIFVTDPSAATTSTVVFGEPWTSSAYFGIAGTLPACRSASILRRPSLTRAPSASSGGVTAGDEEALGAAIRGDAEASGVSVRAAADGDSASAATAHPAASTPRRTPTRLRNMVAEIYD